LQPVIITLVFGSGDRDVLGRCGEKGPMQILSDGTTSYGARRRAHPSLLAAALVVVVSLALLGMVLVDPGQRGSLAIIATLTLLTLPLATLLYGPRQRAPWAVLGATLFVVAVELSLRGAQPGLGGPDTAGMISNVAAGGVFGALLLSEFWMLRSRPSFSGEVHDRDTGVVIALSLAGAFGIALAVTDAGVGPSVAAQRWPLFVVGIGLSLGGLALRGWAIATLGPFFQARLVIQQDHSVVSDGPYRVVRHPSYVGPVLMFGGIGLLLDNWVALAVCLVLPIGAYIRRIAVEEQLLANGLGAEYERYRETTWRMLPGVW
jgi:protein-S-isoprenylcysteine O-methyltransferase